MSYLAISRRSVGSEISITVTPVSQTRFNLKLRVPGYVIGIENPGDLYASKNNRSNDFEIFLNGKKINGELVDGYFNINHYWTPGDTEIVENIMSMAASISQHALSNNYTVGLLSNDMQTQDSKAFIVSPGRGEYQLTKILESLANINTLAYAPMAEHLIEVCRSFPMGSTVAICISYVSDDLLNSIEY